MCTGIEEIIGAIVSVVVSVVETAAPVLGVAALGTEAASIIAYCLGDPELSNFFGSLSSILGIGAGITGGLASVAEGVGSLASFGSAAADAGSGLTETAGATGLSTLEDVTAVHQIVGGVAEVGLTLSGKSGAAAIFGAANGALGNALGFAQGGVDTLHAASAVAGTELSIGSLIAGATSHDPNSILARTLGVASGTVGYGTALGDYLAAPPAGPSDVDFSVGPPVAVRDDVGTWDDSVSWARIPGGGTVHDEGDEPPVYAFNPDRGEAIASQHDIAELASGQTWSEAAVESAANVALGVELIPSERTQSGVVGLQPRPVENSNLSAAAFNGGQGDTFDPYAPDPAGDGGVSSGGGGPAWGKRADEGLLPEDRAGASGTRFLRFDRDPSVGTVYGASATPSGDVVAADPNILAALGEGGKIVQLPVGKFDTTGNFVAPAPADPILEGDVVLIGDSAYSVRDVNADPSGKQAYLLTLAKIPSASVTDAAPSDWEFGLSLDPGPDSLTEDSPDHPPLFGNSADGVGGAPVSRGMGGATPSGPWDGLGGATHARIAYDDELQGYVVPRSEDLSGASGTSPASRGVHLMTKKEADLQSALTLGVLGGVASFGNPAAVAGVLSSQPVRIFGLVTSTAQMTQVSSDQDPNFVVAGIGMAGGALTMASATNLGQDLIVEGVAGTGKAFGSAVDHLTGLLPSIEPDFALASGPTLSSLEVDAADSVSLAVGDGTSAGSAAEDSLPRTWQEAHGLGETQFAPEVGALQERQFSNLVGEEAEAALAEEVPPTAEPQVSFKNGDRVPAAARGSVRPDFWDAPSQTAFESKAYDLSDPAELENMIDDVASQVRNRVQNLPSGSTQVVVVEARGFGLSDAEVDAIRQEIYQACGRRLNLSDIRFRR